MLNVCLQESSTANWILSEFQSTKLSLKRWYDLTLYTGTSCIKDGYEVYRNYKKYTHREGYKQKRTQRK